MIRRNFFMRNYMTDSAFRLSDLRLYNLRLLCFWPIFFLVFTYAEKFFPAAHYFSMHCRLDDLIPFCEWFVIPYVIWFPFVGSMVFYTLLRDAAAFRRLMRFIILTYSAALLVFFLFPTCQYLRPALLFRGNPLVRLVASIYANDTNTNVCPSIHVIGSLAVWFAARDTGKLPAILRKGAIPIMAVLISISTVFLKQHSVLDIIAALLVCAAAYPVVYRSVPARHPVSLRTRALSSRKYPQL